MPGYQLAASVGTVSVDTGGCGQPAEMWLWIHELRALVGRLIFGLLVGASPVSLAISIVGRLTSLVTWTPPGMLASGADCVLSGVLVALRVPAYYVILKR